MTIHYLEQSRLKAEELKNRDTVRILAIESSCDETAAAVVENGRVILSNAVFSQIPLHALYGGVVPEIASRAHVDAVDRMVDRALQDAGLSFNEIDALAVTCGPGLVGALLTGVSCAKALAWSLNKPLIPVNHIEGHICANYLTDPDLTPPFLCLVASGGHSHILNVGDYGVYRLLGCTQDDAAGEAFDKAARVLHLPYPGGPLLDKLAQGGDPQALKLPRAHTPGPYDFSFSGLKTAFINAVHNMEQKGQSMRPEDLAASFQYAVVDALVTKTMQAALDTHASRIALAGGVSANSGLRDAFRKACSEAGIRLYMPRPELCGDNAAMIGSAAYWRLLRGEIAGLDLNAKPSFSILPQVSS